MISTNYRRVDSYHLTYLYLLVRMLFSRFAIRQSLWDLILLLLSSVFIYQSIRKDEARIRYLLRFFEACSVIILAALLNLMITRIDKYWFENLYDLLKHSYIVFLVIYMISIDRDRFNVLFNSSFVFLNAYAVINLVVVTLQIQIHGFLMRPEHVASSNYYPDLCAGFFGHNGTHRLTFFYAFLLLYNTYLIRYRIRRNRKLLLLHNSCLLIWCLAVSKGNENPSFLLFLVIYTFFYFTNSAYFRYGPRSFIYIRKILIPILFLVYLVYAYSLNITGETDGILVNKISLALHSLDGVALGSNERIGIIARAFHEGVAQTVGFGFGANKWSDSSLRFMGFSHFGLSSASSIIALSGIWFYVLLLMFYLYLYKSIFKNIRINIIVVTIIFVITSSTLYTDVFNNDITIFWLSMYFVLLSFTVSRDFEWRYPVAKCNDKYNYSNLQQKAESF